MKYRYDKQDDILMIWLSKESVDYAEKKNDVIIHYSKNNKPILLEILKASKFIEKTSDITKNKPTFLMS